MATNPASETIQVQTVQAKLLADTAGEALTCADHSKPVTLAQPSFSHGHVQAEPTSAHATKLPMSTPQGASGRLTAALRRDRAASSGAAAKVR
jgi:hypothetical protein